MISAGVRYMFFSVLFFSVMQVIVKYLNHVPVFQIILFRTLISMGICLFMLTRQKVSPWGNNKMLLVLRGVFGVLALSCFFYSLQHTPLGPAITIVNIKPFLILVLGFLLLKEKVLPIQWVLFIVSFCGILLIKGFDTTISFLELGTLLGAAFFAAIAHTIVRKLKDSDHPLVIIFYFTLITFPIAFPIAMLHWVELSLLDLVLLLSVGIVTHFGQFFLTKAYQQGAIASVSLVYYLGIVFALMFGYLFFDEMFDWIVILGITLIVGSILLNVLFVQRAKSKRTN